MIMAATEAYYQVETLEDRKFSEKDEKMWMVGANLGLEARETFKGKPIEYYWNI